MKPHPPKPKAIKPRRMWAEEEEYGAYLVSNKKGKLTRRPVLVIDLSPESVEALVNKLAEMHTPARPVTEAAQWAARHQLAAIGVKARRAGK